MNAYFIENFGETIGPIIGIGALVVLIAIALWLALVLIRRFRSGLFISGGSKGRQPRLAVTDAVPVDSQRRLVLVRRDDVEHLILIGGPTDIVVEAGIGQPQPVTTQQPRPAAQPTQPAQRPAIVAAKEAVADVERGRLVRVPETQSQTQFTERREETMTAPPVVSSPNVSPAMVSPPAAPPIMRAVEAPASIQTPLSPPAVAATRPTPELDLDTLLNELRPNSLQDR